MSDKEDKEIEDQQDHLFTVAYRLDGIQYIIKERALSFEDACQNLVDRLKVKYPNSTIEIP